MSSLFLQKMNANFPKNLMRTTNNENTSRSNLKDTALSVAKILKQRTAKRYLLREKKKNSRKTGTYKMHTTSMLTFFNRGGNYSYNFRYFWRLNRINAKIEKRIMAIDANKSI